MTLLVILWLLSGLIPSLLVLGHLDYRLTPIGWMDITFYCLFAVCGPAMWAPLISALMRRR